MFSQSFFFSTVLIFKLKVIRSAQKKLKHLLYLFLSLLKMDEKSENE